MVANRNDDMDPQPKRKRRRRSAPRAPERRGERTGTHTASPLPTHTTGGKGSNDGRYLTAAR